MKRIALLITCIALTCASADAQSLLQRLGQRAKNAAEQNIGNKVEKGVNDLLNGKVGTKSDNNQKEQQQSTTASRPSQPGPGGESGAVSPGGSNRGSSASNASHVQTVSELDLVVGQTITYTAAGTHLTGFTLEQEDDYVQASQSKAFLTVKGLKKGEAIIQLSLRSGQSSKLIVHVLPASGARPSGSTDKPEDEPKWTGNYELRLPQNNYSIIVHSFRENGEEWMRETYSCIDNVFVRSENFKSEDGYDGMEDIIYMFDYSDGIGYEGGLYPDGHYEMVYGYKNDDREDAKMWFNMYAPKTQALALYNTEPAGFGRDNHGDDSLPIGTIIQRLRMAGVSQSQLNQFYRGIETVCGRNCWVFDFRGRDFYGYGGFRIWVDPETGLVLRQDGGEGVGFLVTRFDLNYTAWDIQIRPELYE